MALDEVRPACPTRSTKHTFHTTSGGAAGTLWQVGEAVTQASQDPPSTNQVLHVNHQQAERQTYGVDVTLEEESSQSERRTDQNRFMLVLEMYAWL